MTQKESANMTSMWSGIPDGVYSQNVWKSVTAVEPFLSELDRQWNNALLEMAKLLQIKTTEVSEVVYELEKATIARLKKGSNPSFVTLSGPGAVGKGTIRTRMHITKNTVNDTTRARRGEGDKAEKDGEQYFFLDEATFKSREANNEYVYPPIFKPGRGWYGLQKEQLNAPLASGEPFVVDDNLIVSEFLFNYWKSLNNGSEAPLHIYVLPPAPVMATLALRVFKRAEDTNDPRYIKPDGLIVIPEEEITSTIGQRQVDEFKPAFDLFKAGAQIVFIVNDRLERVDQVFAQLGI